MKESDLNKEEEEILTAIHHLISKKNSSDKESVFKLAEKWKVENPETAVTNLLGKSLINLTGKEYNLTPEGKLLALHIRKKNFKEGFDTEFTNDYKSRTYRKFCNEVYGLDLMLFSMIDKEQIEALEKEAEFKRTDKVIDLGCGMGELIEYLADKHGFYGTGADIAKQMIQISNERTNHKKNICYKEIDIDNLNELEEKFDKILVVDSLYFVSDIKKAAQNIYNLLENKGKAFIFYTNNNNSKSYFDDKLNELKIEFRKIDFSENEKLYWKKTIEIAEKYKDEFISESNEALYNGRIREASDFVDKEVYRYLYIIEKNR